jgi:uncharacterized peroxidase-related enzyme
MTYIKTGLKLPGILELLYYKPSTGKALAKLSHVLLHGPSGLSPAEREIIAAYVSNLNSCNFCYGCHSASASAHLNDGGNTVACVVNSLSDAPVSDKMKSLLRIAGKVTESGRNVTREDIDHALTNGATDEDIHDAILVASAFCMFNRYVDGLATSEIADDENYAVVGKRLATKGYKYAPLFIRKFVIRMMEKQIKRKSPA